MDISDKLMRARCRLMSKQPFYGHICIGMEWIKSEMSGPVECRTMGVRIVNGGRVQCLYYPDFVEKMTLEETYGVVQHEIEHLVRLHTLRVGSRNHQLWNIACDAVVNGKRSKPRIGYEEPTETKLPFKNDLIFIPDDWPEEGSADQFYALMLKQVDAAKKCKACGMPIFEKKGDGGGSGNSEGEGQDEKEDPKGNGKGKGKKESKEGDSEDQNGQGGSGGQQKKKCSCCGQKKGEYQIPGITGRVIDDHSIWNDSDVSADEARQVVKELVQQAIAQSRGNVPGHLQEAIKALTVPKVRWREALRGYVGRYTGNRRKTYARANRRNPNFGLAGFSHRAAAKVNVIVDTSGSVSHEQLVQFMTEIESMCTNNQVYVLQWDHDFQGFNRYRRGDWKKWKFNGRGGTDMRMPVQWLMQNKLIANVQILLTDGYTPWNDESEITFPMVTVITSAKDQVPGPSYGKTVHINVGE